MKLITNYPKFESLQDRIAYKKRQHERLRQQMEVVNYSDSKLGEYAILFLGGVFIYFIIAAIFAYAGLR